MKTALVAIAKDEDNYLDEWIDYNLKLGFDDIFVYQNCWRAHPKNSSENIHLIEYDGDGSQMEAYLDFIRNRSIGYDFAAFFDIDEYLCFKSPHEMNLKKFLDGFINYHAIGINWRLFGDSGLEKVENGDYSLVKRFRKACNIQNKHIKTILNLKFCRDHNFRDFLMKDPHSFNASFGMNFTISTDKSHYIQGPFNERFDPTVQLNHYYCKTIEEFNNIKNKRGRGDVKESSGIKHYNKQQFDEGNRNDIVDDTAYNFFISRNIQL